MRGLKSLAHTPFFSSEILGVGWRGFVRRESQSVPLPAEELWVGESRQPGNRSANQFNQRLVSTPGSSKGARMPSPLWPLTLCIVCPGKIQVAAQAPVGSKPLWKRKWVGEALAMVPECNQKLKSWKTEERGSQSQTSLGILSSSLVIPGGPWLLGGCRGTGIGFLG